MYWLEIGLGIITPLILLSFKKIRQNPTGLFFGAVMIIIGFILNRMNISITGMEAWAGISYFPSWMEIMVTVAIVTAGFVVFSYAARYLPVFKHETEIIRPVHDMNEDLRIISQVPKEEYHNEMYVS